MVKLPVRRPKSRKVPLNASTSSWKSGLPTPVTRLKSESTSTSLCVPLLVVIDRGPVDEVDGSNAVIWRLAAEDTVGRCEGAFEAAVDESCDGVYCPNEGRVAICAANDPHRAGVPIFLRRTSPSSESESQSSDIGLDDDSVGRCGGEDEADDCCFDSPA